MSFRLFHGRHVPKSEKKTFFLFQNIMNLFTLVKKEKSEFIDALVSQKFSLRLPHQTVGSKMKLPTEVAKRQKVPIFAKKLRT